MTKSMPALHAVTSAGVMFAALPVAGAEPTRGDADSRVAAPPVGQLKALIAQGLTLPQAMKAFAELRSPEELDYVAAAKEQNVEGSMEVDDNAAVSIADAPGAYVMSWLWVDASELAAPTSLAQAVSRRFNSVIVARNNEKFGPAFDLEFHPENVKFDLDVLKALAAGAPVSDDAVAIELCVPNATSTVTITVGEVKGLRFLDTYEGFVDVRNPEGDAVIIFQ